MSESLLSSKDSLSDTIFGSNFGENTLVTQFMHCDKIVLLFIKRSLIGQVSLAYDRFAEFLLLFTRSLKVTSHGVFVMRSLIGPLT